MTPPADSPRTAAMDAEVLMAELRLSDLICGLRTVMGDIEDSAGCGQSIITVAEVYRCTECRTPFHRGCANRHFAIEAEAAGSEGLRAALERLMEAVRSVVSPHETSVDAYTVLWDPMAQADAAIAAQPAESGE